MPSQMSAADQAVVKAMPGNKDCADCNKGGTQWASVSFGTVFCLECSGTHRSLGVHISFVRSIDMDSWTDKQLALMKNGGNKKFNDYLASKGIPPNTPIKQKYESEAAQLYKLRLKARVEGRPEPTSLPPPKNKRMAAPSTAGMGGFGSAQMGSNDPNGMERLTGETDQQYIARQTRLKAEAKARMAAKFGNNGGRMGGVGSTMQGIGSNPNYNPHSGYGAPDINLNNAINSMTGAFSSGLSIVSSAVNDQSTRASVSQFTNKAANMGGNLASTATLVGGSFWNSLKSTVDDVAGAVAQPGEGDGLAALQRDIQTNMPTKSKYSGFGSSNTGSMNPSSSSMFDNFGSSSSMGGMAQQQRTRGVSTPPVSGGGALQEAPGLPGEDRNGMQRLTGETDEQYVMRQTRLRDEAKARMAAKFGGGGLSSAGPSSSSYTPAVSRPTAALQEAPGLPGEDRNGMERLTGETDEQYVMRQTRLRNEAKARMAAKFGGGGLSSAGPSSSTYTPSASRPTSAPSSGNASSYPTGMSLGAKKPTPVKAPVSAGNPVFGQSTGGFSATSKKPQSSDDFFANFGA